MCGIHAVISSDPARHTISPNLERRLRNRGPDHLGSEVIQLSSTDPSLFLTLTSTVLSLRGDHIARQPLVDHASGSVLSWNGEAWKIHGHPVQGNDGEAVLSLLATTSGIEDNRDKVLNVLRAVEGPFAFIYLDKPAKCLYYGRDRLGRRSLLVKAGAHFSLSSTAEPLTEGWAEVEADGCYTLDLNQTDLSHGPSPDRHNWNEDTTLVSCLVTHSCQA